MYTDLVLQGKGKEIQSKTMFENLEAKISHSLREDRIFFVIYSGFNIGNLPNGITSDKTYLFVAGPWVSGGWKSVMGKRHPNRGG